MGLIKEPPTGLASGNDLDNLPDDLPTDTNPAQIHFAGKTLLVMDNPPVKGEYIKVELTLRCKGQGDELLADDEVAYHRKMVLIGAKVTTDPYKPTPPPAMLNADGTVNLDAVADPDDAEDLETQDDDADDE